MNFRTACSVSCWPSDPRIHRRRPSSRLRSPVRIDLRCSRNPTRKADCTHRNASDWSWCWRKSSCHRRPCTSPRWLRRLSRTCPRCRVGRPYIQPRNRHSWPDRCRWFGRSGYHRHHKRSGRRRNPQRSCRSGTENRCRTRSCIDRSGEDHSSHRGRHHCTRRDLRCKSAAGSPFPYPAAVVRHHRSEAPAERHRHKRARA